MHYHADMHEVVYFISNPTWLTCREDELRTAHTVFQSTFDKEKRREAERKAEMERQRRVEVPCLFTLINVPQSTPPCGLSALYAAQPQPYSVL